MTILDVINENIVNMAEDMNTMHRKIDELYNAICSQREPNPDGSDMRIAGDNQHTI